MLRRLPQAQTGQLGSINLLTFLVSKYKYWRSRFWAGVLRSLPQTQTGQLG